MVGSRSVFRLMLPAGALLLVATGCLNLGGRTTYVQDNPEASARIKALETRVAALEQAFSTGSVQTYQPSPSDLPLETQ